MDQILPGLLNGVGIVGMLVLLWWMLATGHLFTKRQFDDKAHEADEWHAESRIKDQQIQEKDDQLRHLAEVGRTVAAIMTAVQSEAREVRGTAEPPTEGAR